MRVKRSVAECAQVLLRQFGVLCREEFAFGGCLVDEWKLLGVPFRSHDGRRQSQRIAVSCERGNNRCFRIRRDCRSGGASGSGHDSVSRDYLLLHLALRSHVQWNFDASIALNVIHPLTHSHIVIGYFDFWQCGVWLEIPHFSQRVFYLFLLGAEIAFMRGVRNELVSSRCRPFAVLGLLFAHCFAEIVDFIVLRLKRRLQFGFLRRVIL